MAWTRGKLNVQYDLTGYDRQYSKSIEAACENAKKNGKKVEVDPENLNENDVLKSYSYNLYQVII